MKKEEFSNIEKFIEAKIRHYVGKYGCLRAIKYLENKKKVVSEGYYNMRWNDLNMASQIE